MRDIQLQGLREHLTGCISALKKSKRPELDFAHIEQTLKDFKNALEVADIEIRQMKGSSESDEWRKVRVGTFDRS